MGTTEDAPTHKTLEATREQSRRATLLLGRTICHILKSAFTTTGRIRSVLSIFPSMSTPAAGAATVSLCCSDYKWMSLSEQGIAAISNKWKQRLA